MTGIEECGRYLQRYYSMARFLMTERISSKNTSKVYSVKVFNLKAKMKNKLMLRNRYIIECINELLKNKANIVHSRHQSIHNFIMNLCSALTAYCFFETKPGALPVYAEKSRLLELFAY